MVAAAAPRNPRRVTPPGLGACGSARSPLAPWVTRFRSDMVLGCRQDVRQARQWAVVSLTGSPVAWAVALGLPALFAGATAARLLAVTQVIRVVHDSRRRRP